jgi:signal transduction histidine kinase/GAF domain-containing protein/ActR/RegA family two-component response regulator
MNDMLPPTLDELAASLPVAIWKADREGRLVHASAGLAQLTDIASLEIKKADWQAILPAAEIEKLTDAFHSASAVRSPFQIRTRSKATRAGACKILLLSAKPAIDCYGCVSGWVGLLIEDAHAPEHVQVELRFILDQIDDGILLFDAQGICSAANRAALQITSLHLDALIGSNLDTLLGRRQPVWDDSVREANLFARSKAFDADDGLFIRGASGTIVDAVVTCRPMGPETGAAPIGSVVRLSTKRVSPAPHILPKLELDIIKATSAGQSLDEICHFITTGVDEAILGSHSSIVLIDDCGVMQQCIGAGLPSSLKHAVRGRSIAEGEAPSGTAAFRKKLVVVCDISADPLFDAGATFVRDYGYRSCWALPILDADGNTMAVFSTYCDRSRAPSDDEIALVDRIAEFVRLAIERTRDRNKIRTQEARYRTIFDLVPVGIWQNDVSDVETMINSIRKQGVVDIGAYLDEHPEFISDAIRATRVVDANPAALTQYGITGDKNITEAFQNVSLSPQSLRTTRDILVAVFEGRTRVELIDKVKNAAGRNITLLTRVHIPPDHPDRFLLCETDVTEHYRAVELFETVARISSDVIWQRDVETDETWNSDIDGRLNHGETGALHKRDFWIDHLHPDDRETTVARADAAINGDAAELEYEYRYRRGDGTYALIREKAAYIRDDQGKTVRVIGNMVDISERRLLEDKLRQSQRLQAVGQLTGGIAHDFNNLLTIIIGNIERVVSLLEPKDEASQLALIALKASERAAELITRLLAFARKQPLTPKPMDANATIRGMYDLLKRTLTPAVELQHFPAEALWSAHVDVVQFESALLNLCVNARDAMPGGGHLTIRTGNVTLGTGVLCQGELVEPGDYILVSVSDTGHGMSEDILPRVFEPFFSTKPVGQGSGLGLSMVFGFLRQSRGHILVDSKPGQGTTMRLYLPRSSETGLPDRNEDQHPDPVHLSLRVLVVDDDTSVRECIAQQVRSIGCEVLAVADARAALEVLSVDNRFDIVFSDVVMPGGISGLQLAEIVTQDYPHIRLVLSSGHSIEQVGVGINKKLRAIFLKKPYRRAKLVAALQDAMKDFA